MKASLIITVAFAAGVFVDAQTQRDATPGTLDQSSPIAALEALFEAARTGDVSYLSQLCPPSGGNDIDTQRICDVTADSPELEAFKQFFGTGEVTGEPRMSATVPFSFGPPERPRPEQMEMLRLDGKWYITDF
jgi:hypothetical protein